MPKRFLLSSRQARLNAEAVKSHGDAIRLQLSSRYRSLLQEAQRLVALIAQMDSTLPTADADLLHRAFLAGELSLTDYLLEQGLSSSALARRLAAQRDLHLHSNPAGCAGGGALRRQHSGIQNAADRCATDDGGGVLCWWLEQRCAGDLRTTTVMAIGCWLAARNK